MVNCRSPIHHDTKDISLVGFNTLFFMVALVGLRSKWPETRPTWISMATIMEGLGFLDALGLV